MSFVLKADAADMLWVRTILAKEAEDTRRPESIEMGHWTAEDWKDLETSARWGS